MSNQSSDYIFSILIFLTFTFTNVYGVTCSYNQKICNSYPDTWCCPNSSICGIEFSTCSFPTASTPKSSSSSPSGFLAVLFVFPIFCGILCIYAAIRSQQRSSSSVVTVNHQGVRNSHRQYPIQRQRGIIHARPVHTVSPTAPTPSLYEGPPPSYEAATSDLPPKYQSVPVTAMVDRTNL